MIRVDLLALAEGDLVVLANRGLVRRATRDVADRADLALTIDDDGAVTVAADDATTTLPAGARPEDASCTCVAGGVCRHVVRAILAYQAVHGRAAGAADEGTAAAGVGGHAEAGRPRPSAEDTGPTTQDATRTAQAAVAAPPGTPWDPGVIDDAALEAAVGPRTMARARAILATATPVALVRAATPVARLLDAGVAVRFLVPGDVGWARCTCAAAQPCAHAVVAVRAFRTLAADRAGGTIEVGVRGPVDEGARREVEAAVLLLAEAGAASASAAVLGLIERAAGRAAGHGWAWIAEALLDLAEASRRHAAADPAFVPTQVVDRAGEVLARLDALDASRAPRGLVAGGAPRGDVEVRGGVLVGLGTIARRVGRTTAVDAVLLDGGGQVARAGRTMVDPEDGRPPAFSHVASGALRAGIACADAGRGQLVTTGARIQPDGRLVLGRRRAALSAQSYDWESRLPAGVLSDGFAQAAALAGTALPRVLGSRTVGSGFAVVPVADADGGWDPVEHAVVLRLRDHASGAATLVHPYAAQGAGGVEALLHATSAAGRVRAVAGWVAPHPEGPRVRACGVVVEDASGHRSLVQPWTDPAPGAGGGSAPAGNGAGPAAGDGAAARSIAAGGLVADLREALGDLLTAGVGRPDGSGRRRWAGLLRAAEDAGSVLLVGPVRRLAVALDRSALEASWEPGDAVRAATDLAVLVAVGVDGPQITDI